MGWTRREHGGVCTGSEAVRPDVRLRAGNRPHENTRAHGAKTIQVSLRLSSTRHRCAKRFAHDGLGLGLDLLQVLLVAKALGIDLVYLLGTGWPRREPTTLGNHLNPADRLAIPGCVGENGLDLLPSQRGTLDTLFAHLRQHRLLLCGCGGIRPVVQRVAKLPGEIVVNLAWILMHSGGDLDCQQSGDDAVLVGGPHSTVTTQEGGAGALFTHEPELAFEQSVDEVLEAYRNFEELSAQPGGDPIDHAAADDRLANGDLLAPLGAMLEEIVDAHREIVVGRQQSPAPGHDAVAVMVGVAGDSDIELVLQRDQ